MSKEAVLNKIKDVGIVAVIRAESVEQAAKITDACVAGGVTTVELCFTVPNADQLISQMVKKYEGTDVTIGAGTVLDPATARIAYSCSTGYGEALIKAALMLDEGEVETVSHY